MHTQNTQNQTPQQTESEQNYPKLKAISVSFCVEISLPKDMKSKTF